MALYRLLDGKSVFFSTYDGLVRLSFLTHTAVNNMSRYLHLNVYIATEGLLDVLPTLLLIAHITIYENGITQY